MNIREKELQALKRYEQNLKVHLDLEKSTLETILRVSMPHQLSNMKTILWINLLMIGLSLQLLEKFNFNLFLFIFWFFSFIAVTLIVIAMLQRRYKYYAEIYDPEFAYKLNDNLPTSHSKMLGEALITVIDAIKNNREIMAYLAKYMHASLWFTLGAVLSFLLYSGFGLYQKGELKWLKNQSHQNSLQLNHTNLYQKAEKEDINQIQKNLNNPLFSTHQKAIK